MHAFMSLNMVGAVLLVPQLGRWLDRGLDPRKALVVLAALDAALLLAIAQPWDVRVILALRTLEGAAHVGAATVLLSEAAALARSQGRRAMALAGAAIIFAVALGSALGGVLVRLSVQAPFWAGSALALGVAAWAARSTLPDVRREDSAPTSFGSVLRDKGLWVPLWAAFVGRFTVGCVVVTFALFAHKQHALSDSAIGFLFSALTLSFAVAMYPTGHLAERWSRASLLAAGGFGYGCCLLFLGYAPAGLLPLVMIGAGTSSALLYGVTLCYAAQLGGTESRGKAMAAVNAAGCFGMLLGPPCAGVMAAIFRSEADPVAGYRAAFLLAAGSVLVWLAVSGRWLLARGREETRARLPSPTA